MSKERFMLRCFILVAMRIVPRGYIMRDDLAIDSSLLG